MLIDGESCDVQQKHRDLANKLDAKLHSVLYDIDVIKEEIKKFSSFSEYMNSCNLGGKQRIFEMYFKGLFD